MAKSRPPNDPQPSLETNQREALESLASAVVARRKRRGALRAVEDQPGSMAGPTGRRGPVKHRRWGGTQVHWKGQGIGDGSPTRQGIGEILGRRDGSAFRTPPLAFQCWDEISQRLLGREWIFFLDYDGTLAWIASRPELAKLPMAARITLDRLAERHPVHLIGGRARADLQTLVPVPRIRIQGDHGFELDVEPPAFLASLDLRSLDLMEARLSQVLGGMRGVFFERKSYTLAVHYRLAEEGGEARIRSEIQRLLPSVEGWLIEKGRRVFEIRPSVSWGKGEAIAHILEELAIPNDVIPISIGDDETDESAFRSLARRGLTVRVDPLGRASSAQYRVRNPTDVHVFLDRLIDELSS